IGFATPLVFILGAMGLYLLLRRDAGASSARVLVSVMFWPITLYFVVHSFHSRVEANWFGPVYPAFAIAAAAAAHSPLWRGRAQRTAEFCRNWAVPVGVVMMLALIVQANTGLLTGYRRDASVRSIGVGWPALAKEIDAVRLRTGASCVMAPDYG